MDQTILLLAQEAAKGNEKAAKALVLLTNDNRDPEKNSLPKANHWDRLITVAGEGDENEKRWMSFGALQCRVCLNLSFPQCWHHKGILMTERSPARQWVTPCCDWPIDIQKKCVNDSCPSQQPPEIVRIRLYKSEYNYLLQQTEYKIPEHVCMIKCAGCDSVQFPGTWNGLTQVRDCDTIVDTKTNEQYQLEDFAFNHYRLELDPITGAVLDPTRHTLNICKVRFHFDELEALRVHERGLWDAKSPYIKSSDATTLTTLPGQEPKAIPIPKPVYLWSSYSYHNRMSSVGIHHTGTHFQVMVKEAMSGKNCLLTDAYGKTSWPLTIWFPPAITNFPDPQDLTRHTLSNPAFWRKYPILTGHDALVKYRETSGSGWLLNCFGRFLHHTDSSCFHSNDATSIDTDVVPLSGVDINGLDADTKYGYVHWIEGVPYISPPASWGEQKDNKQNEKNQKDNSHRLSVEDAFLLALAKAFVDGQVVGAGNIGLEHRPIFIRLALYELLPYDILNLITNYAFEYPNPIDLALKCSCLSSTLKEVRSSERMRQGIRDGLGLDVLRNVRSRFSVFSPIAIDSDEMVLGLMWDDTGLTLISARLDEGIYDEYAAFKVAQDCSSLALDRLIKERFIELFRLNHEEELAKLEASRFLQYKLLQACSTLRQQILTDLDQTEFRLDLSSFNSDNFGDNLHLSNEYSMSLNDLTNLQQSLLEQKQFNQELTKLLEYTQMKRPEQVYFAGQMCMFPFVRTWCEEYYDTVGFEQPVFFDSDPSQTCVNGIVEYSYKMSFYY